ncbi:MMPL family transporter [Actinocrispum sp. NPDC049592]|uniref:MMPL family transporter n=1 Tax=Actinocrispum sp. NPDC049592 TaxID=3154835 RepID=UPI003433FE06
MVGSPYQSKLSEVMENSNSAFLPKSAEATKVDELVKGFAEREDIAGILLFERETGVTDADRQFIAGRLAEVKDMTIGQQNVSLADRVSPVIPAQDGKAAQVLVAFPEELHDQVPGATNKLREITKAGVPSGLTVFVTGEAGISADFSEAFDDIDGMLLWVAIAVVVGILILIYRSPLLPLVVLMSGGFALITASMAVYFLTKAGVLTLNGQSQGILMVLVLGAATDYALLLVSRYREELRLNASKYEAMRKSLRACVEPLVASGGTVILGLLCLLLSDLNSNKSLGPVAAIGILASLLTALTFLPAMLVLLGRGAFWPFRPKEGTVGSESKGIWARVATLVGNKPRLVGAGTAVVLLGCLAFLPQFKADGLQFSDAFTSKTESVRGMEAFAKHYPAGTGTPTTIITKSDYAGRVADAARTVPGVASVEVQPKIVNGLQVVDATLDDDPSSTAAQTTVQRLRTSVHGIPGADALVGGATAAWLDTHDTSVRDLQVIIPVVLVVILLVLALLLRSLVAPVLLTLTVAISYGATLGVGALVFEHIFGFANSDPSLPMFAFVFLVALGIDYNIFLMTRVREEAQKLGTRQGTLKGLAVTGGVITSAGVVLAATFGALALLPMVFLVQMAFLVAFGVLMDTLIVRSLLVPALTLQIGRKIWWPSKLAKGRA